LARADEFISAFQSHQTHDLGFPDVQFLSCGHNPNHHSIPSLNTPTSNSPHNHGTKPLKYTFFQQKMCSAPQMSPCEPPPETTMASRVCHTNEAELFEHRKKTVKSSWRAIQFALDEKATKIFYDRLFSEYPSVRPMFKDDMTSQHKKLYAAVSLAVKCIDDLESLVPVLQDLGRRHGSYGVVREHYDAVTDCFLWTLNTFIFANMPTMNAIHYAFDVADAWEWTLMLIGTTMADAADEADIEKEIASQTT
jgi:hemoglobin-like flavoprotein